MLRSLTLASVVLLPALAQAAATSGIAWPLSTKLDVEIGDASADIDQQTLMEQTRSAFELWSAESDTAPSMKVAKSKNAKLENDGAIHRISVVTEDWVSDGDALAVTTYTFKKSSGEITDADIIVNGTGPCLSFEEALPKNCYDARAIMIHEAGHFIGIGHSPEEPDSIMFPTLAPGDDSKRALAPFDVETLRASYPPQTPKAEPTPTPAKAPSPAIVAPEDLAARFGATNATLGQTPASGSSGNTGSSKGCAAANPAEAGLWLLAALLALRTKRTPIL
jgi:hypothetical protein